MKRLVTGNVWWVGKVDWELRRFHGNEYSTHRGSSYNSYLIREGKTVLVDTVWQPFAKEYVDNLEAEVGLGNIDFIVQNHAETDHSGALPELMRRRPDLPIYCTANGVKSLTGLWHGDWDFHVVKTGDSLDIGKGKKLVFVEAPMLHWPDSMFTYLTGDSILFSNDAFGQHYASEALFNDLVAQDELWAECIKYYANILTPFSALVTRKIDELLGKMTTRPEDNWSIEEMAEYCNLSVNHFRRIFSTQTGLNPKEYQNTIKIEHAKMLLCSSDMSISSISEKLGYSDQYHFSRRFKETTGFSPSKFKSEFFRTGNPWK